ncbi:MAG: NAD(P)/FAD-dependent oxidoreductase [Ruminococcaceae bacterium]|nr:NAD(P)/FAD-dependent oxidoreductase [Oscillospiraceae bacterium]
MPELKNAAEVFDVGVIGAGPAGMMAAIFAAQSGASVILYEKNPMVGKKLRITGKGRCNVTNDCTPDEFLKNVINGGKFLYSALYRFTPADAIEFFEGAGVPLKTERGRRVFPVSDSARDVAEALLSEVKLSGVRIKKETVRKILTENGRTTGVVTDTGSHRHKAVIVATGGISYPLTGSTGDGYRFARDAGIEVTETRGSLVPVVTKENFSEMSGLSLKNVVLSVKQKGAKKEVFSEMGEMLFTHFGVSGPLVLSASAHMTKELSEYEMYIDLKPALSAEELDRRILSDFAKYSQKDFVNSLSDLLPHKLIPFVIKLSGVPERIKVNSVTKEMRKKLLEALKAFPVTPVKFRPVDEAIVTRGGVSLKELVPGTMECRKVKGLYFAGEVIDADAYTGGYNLQIAYSTGHLAGKAAAEAAFEYDN